ncbi:MAG: hypothetical protein R3E61_08330 [Pseudomonadales bacterium]
MMREAEGHTEEDFIVLSGTKVRQMLGLGIAPPPEFSRPEVAKILMEYYQAMDNQSNSPKQPPTNNHTTSNTRPRL